MEAKTKLKLSKNQENEPGSDPKVSSATSERTETIKLGQESSKGSQVESRNWQKEAPGCVKTT